jgi:HEPN domain-containing protein
MPPLSSTPCDSVTEKALRVFLFSQGKEIVLGHSVARLCGKAAQYQAGFSENEQRLSLLDGYYIPTRNSN